jgi:hypothetical protein
MHYLVTVDHAWQHISLEETVKGLKKCCISIKMMICCAMAVRREGMLGVNVRKMKALTVEMEMETVTLTGTGRWNQTCLCIKCMKLIVKYCFLADILFWGVVLYLINTFYFGRYVLCGGSS